MATMRRIELSSAAARQRADNYSIQMQPPMNLGSGQWSVAVGQIAVWNTYQNINSTYQNQQFSFSIDGGSNVYTATLRPGSYSAPDLIAAMEEQMNELSGTAESPEDEQASDLIVLEVSEATLGFRLTLDTDCSINLAANGSQLYRIFGAEAVEYDTVGTTYFPNQADITNGVTGLQLHCNLADACYNGVASDILFSFSPNMPPGHLYSVLIPYPQFVPCTTNVLNQIALRITDNLGRPVDFVNGPEFQTNASTVTLLLRRDSA